jgi:hypothetical protein
MRRLLEVLLLLSVLAAIPGCMSKSAVWIEAGSNAQRLVFGIATEVRGSDPVDSLTGLEVQSCYSDVNQQRTSWQVGGDLTGESVPIQVIYGSAPPSFMTGVKAQELAPGCYEVNVSGNGIASTAIFDVLSDGSVVERDRDSME